MNSSVVNSTLSALDLKSLSLLAADIPAQLFRLFLCVIGIITNGLVMLVIWRSKELHTKFMLHLAILAASDFILCVLTCARSSHTVYGYLTSTSAVTIALECMARLSWLFYAADANRLMNLVMCVDRMLAVCVPTMYITLSTKKVVISGAVFSFGVSLFLPIEEIAQASEKSGLIPICDINYAASSFFLNIWQTARSVITWIVFIVCIVTILVLVWRIRRAYKTSQSVNQVKKQLEPKAIKATALHCTVYLLTWLAASLGTPMISSSKMPSESKTFYVSFFQAVALLNSSFNLLIYLAMLNGFRKNFLKMFGMAKLAENVQVSHVSHTKAAVWRKTKVSAM